MSQEPSEREHRALRETIGGYVLGQLPAGERAALEQHLPSCAACSQEYAELVPVAAALDDVRAARGGARPDLSAPEGLGRRVEEAVAEDRRRTETRWLVRAGTIAVAAAATVAVVLTVGLRISEPDRPVVPTEAVSITREAPTIDASAALVNHTWGVEVKLRATGFEAGERYRVSVIGSGGRSFPAGEFVGTGSAEMSCNLNSSVLRDRARGFQVTDPDGDVVLVSRF